jgi:hypothetical protein
MHFPGFAKKKTLQAMDELKIFFGDFPNPWVLTASRMSH